MRFRRNSNYGRTAERPRALHGASPVVAELTPFPSLSSFHFRSSVLPLAPRGAGGAAESGKRASPCAEPFRIEGRGSAVSLEEGEGARSLRVRSYQR